MSKNFNFKIEKKLEAGEERSLGRAGLFNTPHGPIKTPAFVSVGTKGAIKGLSSRDLKELGAQVFLANTYHLYLTPGEKVVRDAGGLHKFSAWDGPMMTDSGGFQAFSLGVAFDEGISKVSNSQSSFVQKKRNQNKKAMAKITENGVEFRSHKDGSLHFFTPEKSMEIQHELGADIIFAFDECTSPLASRDYQKEAMERTHRWAERSLARHQKLEKEKKNLPSKIKRNSSSRNPQALFGIVQGGRFRDLREESAKFLGKMDFEGFGIGGSFSKEDMAVAVSETTRNLPEEKPKHLLGIGEPMDLFMGVENGIDFFDCVSPTRLARHGAVYTREGRISLKKSKYSKDFSPIDRDCSCWVCEKYSRSYISHLLREGEILGLVLASAHNLHFIISLVDQIRQAILEDNFFELKKNFFKDFYDRGGFCKFMI